MRKLFLIYFITITNLFGQDIGSTTYDSLVKSIYYPHEIDENVTIDVISKGDSSKLYLLVKNEDKKMGVASINIQDGKVDIQNTTGLIGGSQVKNTSQRYYPVLWGDSLLLIRTRGKEMISTSTARTKQGMNQQSTTPPKPPVFYVNLTRNSLEPIRDKWNQFIPDGGVFLGSINMPEGDFLFHVNKKKDAIVVVSKADNEINRRYFPFSKLKTTSGIQVDGFNPIRWAFSDMALSNIVTSNYLEDRLANSINLLDRTLTVDNGLI
jgi:hypothetical protein